MTNYERVKQMSIEEMVDFINHETDGICSCCHNVRANVKNVLHEKYVTIIYRRRAKNGTNKSNPL